MNTQLPIDITWDSLVRHLIETYPFPPIQDCLDLDELIDYIVDALARANVCEAAQLCNALNRKLSSIYD